MPEQPAQCGDTTVHPPHVPCPGLDGTEVRPRFGDYPALGDAVSDVEPADPLTVTCPSCVSPPGVPCGPDTAHLDRRVRARLNAAIEGTCDLCGGTLWRLHHPDDALHIGPDAFTTCPPVPDPTDDYDGYAAAINAGAVPAHPGVDHWQPLP